jgi:hypothetical protein
MAVGGECDGCLGSRKCWVCLGKGEIEVSRGRKRLCHRCNGNGICAECRVVVLTDADHIALERSV